jgi:hypothetical protein
MKSQVLKTTSRRAALIGLAVTGVVVAGALGVADAAPRSVPTNSVNSVKIVDNSVQSIDIKNGTVASIDLANGTVASVDIANETVTSSDIADATVNNSDIAAGAITNTQIADGSIVGPDLASGLLPRFAHVDGGSTVSILDSTAFSGATVTRSGAGVYQVSFAVATSDCGWAATRTDNANNAATPGFITVEQGGTTTTLVVRTFDTTGAAADTAEDEGFAIVVNC